MRQFGFGRWLRKQDIRWRDEAERVGVSRFRVNFFDLSRPAGAFAILHREDADRAWVGGHGDGPQQHGLDPREDRCIGADAEAQRQNGC